VIYALAGGARGHEKNATFRRTSYVKKHGVEFEKANIIGT
jgi:hypothetical protein